MKFRSLMFLIIIGIAAYFIFYKNDSVWSNLSYFNQSDKTTKLNTLLDNLKQNPPDSLFTELKSNGESWPISMLKNKLLDTDSGQVKFDKTYIKSIFEDSTGFQFKFLKMMFKDKLSDTLSAQDKELIVNKITSGQISLDSAYTLYIEDWVGIDSLGIDFLKDRN